MEMTNMMLNENDANNNVPSWGTITRSCWNSRNLIKNGGNFNAITDG